MFDFFQNKKEEKATDKGKESEDLSVSAELEEGEPQKEESQKEESKPKKEEKKMFGDKAEAEKLEGVSSDVTTILDKECSFEGKMTFEGTVAVYGKFKGEVFSEGKLVIGEGGYVDGKIDIGVIEIQGEVRGNIKAKEKIEINAPAVVQGDISAPSLVIKEGAVFEGTCSMGGAGKENVVDLSSTRSE